MKITPREIEEKFSSTPATDDPAIADLYYYMQRKFISLAWTVVRSCPDHPSVDLAIANLENAYDKAMEAIFRVMELRE